MNPFTRVEPEYRLEHGSYYFYDGTGEMRFMTDEIALCFDLAQETLYKHGRPESVQAFYEKERDRWNASVAEGRMTQSDADVWLANLTIVTGKFDVAEVNRIVANPAYLERFYAKLTAVVLPVPDLEILEPPRS